MGANCCAAAKNTSSQGTAISTYRNLNQSPPWSFRWDNRTRVENFAPNHSHRRKGNSDSKLAAAAETDGLSDKGSGSPCPSTASQAQQLHRSPINIRVSWKFTDDVNGKTFLSTFQFLCRLFLFEMPLYGLQRQSV